MSIAHQFDPESGVMLTEGDPGYVPTLSTQAPVSRRQDRVLTPEELTSQLDKAQAMDSVKDHESLRFRRLQAAAAGTAPPDRPAYGRVTVGDKAYDASDCPREQTRLAAIDAWGGGFIFQPPSASDQLASRIEREELAAIERREQALDALRHSSEVQRAAKARPTKFPRLYFDLA